MSFLYKVTLTLFSLHWRIPRGELLDSAPRWSPAVGNGRQVSACVRGGGWRLMGLREEVAAED